MFQIKLCLHEREKRKSNLNFFAKSLEKHQLSNEYLYGKNKIATDWLKVGHMCAFVKIDLKTF